MIFLVVMTNIFGVRAVLKAFKNYNDAQDFVAELKTTSDFINKLVNYTIEPIMYQG